MREIVSGLSFICRWALHAGTNAVRLLLMSNNEFTRIQDATIARMIRELQSDMADLVEAGEMTDTEANEWVNRKADQWMTQGL